ncbi:MAG TPA: 50S ribosomal protein L25 [Chloroflexi bacterium]|nr:50S ribosomal protein L25 [Chloroflexota bacterium]
MRSVMMEQTELTAQRRTITGKKVKRLRQQGIIPAVLYGPGVESIPIQVEERALNRAMRRAGQRLINLRIEGDPQPHRVLAREVQRDVITGRVLHVDFLEVSLTQKLTTRVPVVLVGEPDPVHRGLAVLLQGVDEVEISCLPEDLISSIEVDVSDLKLDQVIQVKDLRVPAGVEILTEPEEMVAQLSLLRVAKAQLAEEEAIGEEVSPDEVEVIAKGKTAAEEELDEGA